MTQALTWSGRDVLTPSDVELGLSTAAIAEQWKLHRCLKACVVGWVDVDFLQKALFARWDKDSRGYTFAILRCAPIPRSGTVCMHCLRCVASRREIGLPRAAAVFGQKAVDVIASLYLRSQVTSACWALLPCKRDVMNYHGNKFTCLKLFSTQLLTHIDSGI